MPNDQKRETATARADHRKAPWQTPTLEVVDVASETEAAAAAGGDGSSLVS